MTADILTATAGVANHFSSPLTLLEADEDGAGGVSPRLQQHPLIFTAEWEQQHREPLHFEAVRWAAESA